MDYNTKHNLPEKYVRFYCTCEDEMKKLIDVSIIPLIFRGFKIFTVEEFDMTKY